MCHNVAILLLVISEKIIMIMGDIYAFSFLFRYHINFSALFISFASNKNNTFNIFILLSSSDNLLLNFSYIITIFNL